MFERNYGVATSVSAPMIKRGVQDYALSADWTPAAGDVKVSIDGGDVANITTLPTIVGGTGGAVWVFSLSAAEVTGKVITIQVVDSATKAVEDQTLVIRTKNHALANDPGGRDLSGVAVGYGAAAITLASGHVGANDKLNGSIVKIRKSTVAADVGQTRMIVSSTASSDACGVDENWVPALTGTVEYDIYMSSMPNTVEQISAAVLAAAAADPIDANVEQINTVTILGDGSTTPFTV